MSCFFTIFTTTLRQRFIRVRGWILLLLIPCLLLGIRLAVPETAVTAPVQVGVALPEEGAEKLWQLLEARNGTVLTFIESDADTIRRNIATGKWDCGILVDEDFPEKIQQLDTDRIFTVLIGEGSAVHPLVQETVASCTAELVSPHIAQKYLDTGDIAANADPELIQEKLTQILGADDRILISMTTVDGDSLAPFELGESGIRTLLQWVISGIILVWLMLNTCDLGQWMRSSAVKRMLPLRSVPLLSVSRMAADWLLIALSGSFAMAAVGGSASGCIAVLCYSLFWAAIGILLCRFPSIWESLPVLPPFAVVLSLLFSGALLDISIFMPSLSGILRWMPGNLFLQICRGELTPALWLLGTASLFMISSICIDKFTKR